MTDLTCYFCHDEIDPRGLHRHHLNHDHGDNRPENIVDAHPSCHLRYHSRVRRESAKAAAVPVAPPPREAAEEIFWQPSLWKTWTAADVTRISAQLDEMPDFIAGQVLDRLPEELVGDLLAEAMRHVSWD